MPPVQKSQATKWRNGGKFYSQTLLSSLGCEFIEETKQGMNRDQVVDSCLSTDLRKSLLQESNLTLEKVRKISRTYEISDTRAKKMSEDNQMPTPEAEINKLRNTTRQTQANFIFHQCRGLNQRHMGRQH